MNSNCRQRVSRCFSCVLVLIAAEWQAARGVQILLGDGTGNTAPVVGDPGFSNVGNRGGSSGVYIGYGWVLTAAHVPAGDIRLGDTVYDYLPDTDTILKNPTGQGLTEFADLRMYRLATHPNLPSLTISHQSPEAGMIVMMAGNGKDRAPNPTGWTVLGTNQNPTWVETTPPGTIGRENGYKYLPTNSLRWGTNEIATESAASRVAEFVVGNGTRDTISFNTVFDDLPESTEAQGATNDSGGGVFVLRNGTWELGGIMFAIATEAGQPDQTSVFGNRTLASSLSAYADQIESRILQSRVDINSDNNVDAFDAAVLFGEWGTRGADADYNLDGTVDAGDASSLFEFWSGDVTRTASLASHLSGDDLSGMPVYANEIPHLAIQDHYGRGFHSVPEPIWGNLGHAGFVVIVGLSRRIRSATHRPH